MPDSEMNDLFMFITNEDDLPFNGESSLQINKTDDFMFDFRSANYDTYSNFFDVTDFEFNMEMADSDSSSDSGTAGGHGGAASSGPHGDWYMHKDPLKSFASHQQGKGNQYKLKKISGSFGKVVDSVSPVFFQNCCLKKTFKRAVLVKRAFTGASVQAGDSQAQGFLKISMKNVMITSVSWTDGDVVEEKIRFKCDHMDINYKQQTNPGKLGRPEELMNWTWVAAPGNT